MRRTNSLPWQRRPGGEIRKSSQDDGHPRKKELLDWVEREILIGFADSILPFDIPSAKKWGELTAKARREGKTRPPLDAQIAATALAHGMTIVTRNVQDMAYTGADIVNPFQP